MLLTNWLNTLTSRIRKRQVFRSRDRRDIRRRWQSIVKNQISTTEALEDRTLLTTFLVDDNFSGLTNGATIADIDPVTVGDQEGVFGTHAFATIQDAVTAAASSGDLSDIIYIADGTYNENVTVGTSIEFIGAGTAVTTVTGSGILFTVAADDVRFQDMTLENATQGIRVNSVVDNLQVDNVSFEGIVSGTYGIEIHNNAVLTNLSVANSFFSGTGGTGIRMASTAVADGIHVNNTEFDGMKNAINEASNNTVTGGHLRDLQVTNSTFQNISDVSIYAEDMRDSNISGNDFFGNPAGDSERDIVLNNKYSANGMAFGNIQITNNSFSNSDRPAIQLDSRAEAITGAVTISDNTFDSDIGTLTYSWTRIDVNLNSSYSHAPVTINNNSITFTGSASAGSTGTSAISLSGGSDAITISGNTLTDNTTLVGYETTGIFIATDNAYSGAISPTAVINISNNFISGFDAAIGLYDLQASTPGGLTTGAQVNVTNNSLAGNAAGVTSGTGEIVNASGNWWGSFDEGDVAALMTGGVDFSSYLNSDTDTDGGTAGFQGDFSIVNVTALGAQTGPVGRIQEAINLATSGATINVAAGTYAEDVIVNTSVILQGANAGIAAGVGSGVRGSESELTGGFRLFANDVVIDGFKIVDGAGPAGIGDKSAVFMAANTTGHTIENNILEGPGTGVASRGVLSTFNGNNDNITIQNNEISYWAAGIHNQGNTNVNIFGNNIHDVVAGVANDFVTDVSIVGNAFSNSLEGIGVFNNISDGTPDVAAHDNSFDSLTITNLIAHYGGDTVDASGNWWGITDETQIANSMKSDGFDGNASKVDFTSFLSDGTDTDGGTAGFQGDFNIVNVTAWGAQTGPLSRIQEAVEAVNPGGTINIASGTYAGNVDATATGIDKNVRLAPGSSPGQVVIDGDLKLDGNDIVDIEVNGTIAGTEYDQFIVNGDLALGGAMLNLIDGHTPDVAESYILIKNDGPNPVTGTFNGYPEGHEFTDFLGVGGLSAFLTYSGGDGNDVAIYTEVPNPVVTIPNDGAADEYTLQIIGSNVVITEVGSGNVISTYHLAALEGPLVINGEAGVDDQLTIDMTGIDETTDLQIIFNGGAGGHDTLELVNGNLNSMEFRYVDPSTGSIRLNGSGSDFISYTGLEPVTSTVNVTNVTLTFTGGAEIINISDLGGGQTRVNSSLGEMTDFLNPTGTLTINAGTGADTININSLAAGYTADIIINGDDETDTINVNSSVSLAAGKTIQFNAEVVELTGDVTADAITGTAATVNITGSAGGAEIQDAIDLAASGATINVAAGTYAENITLSKQVDLLGAQSGVDARGRGGTLDDALSSIIAPAAGTALDLQSGSAGTTIDGFTFSGGTTGIVSTSGSIDDLQILNNQFVGFTSSGVFLDNSGDDITVHQNVIDGMSQTGSGGIFHLDQDTFDGFHFTSNWVLNGATGFFVDGTRNVSSSASRDPLFEDNLFDGNGAGANFGRFGVENAVVQNNVFSNNDFDGLQGGIQNSLITMNTFDTNDRAGLRFTGFGGTGDATRGAQGNIVEENIFLNNGAGTSAAGYGDVRLDDQFDGTISTNTFFNNSFGSTVAVFNNETSGEVVDFSGNWWATYDDDAVVLKLDGAGAGAVDFTFYLDNGTDTDGITAGFQGDFSILHVTALGAQTGSPDRIAEALAAVTPGGTVKINSGTYNENVNTTATGIDKSVTLATGNSPGQVVINGDLILNSDDTFDFEINGQTVGSGYDQFIVNGAVVLNDAALNLTNTYTPVDGDKFTLIDNDAADGITGEFIGYPEGHEFTNFLGSGLNAYLTYVGGDGNDVVIHMVDSTPEITVPDNNVADQYTLSIVGGNFVLSETVSGTIISTFPVAAINGPLVIIGEDGEDDTLTIDLDTIDHTTDIQIEFRGGAGGNDTLILERSGTINSVEHVFTNASDGSIFLDGEATATITYTGLEPIDDQISATDRIFSFTGADEVITLSNYATPGETLISSTLGESVNFVNPSGTVTIHTENPAVLPLGTGADTINLVGVDAGFTANLTVIAGADDTINTGTVDIGSGALNLNAGQINVNGTFTTTGSVDVDASNQITFAAAGVIDATANTIDLTAGNNIQLGQITTSGSVTVTATAGAISDANAGDTVTGNNITAASAILTAGTGAGVGDALETAISNLEGNISGGLELAELNGIIIGDVSVINGLTVSGNTTIASGGGFVVNENLAVTGGTLQLSNAAGNFDVGFGAIISNNGSNLIQINSAGLIVMTDTGTQITSSGNGTIDLDAAVHILLTNVNTGGEVQVTAAGGQIDDNTFLSEAAVITADTVALSAAGHIGESGNDLDLAVGTVSAVTTAGTIFLESAAGFAVGTVNLLEGITASGNISVVTGGTVTINDKVEATGAAATVLIDSSVDINVNDSVISNGGAIDLLADNDLNLGATSLIDTTIAAVVTLTADSDTSGGGSFTQTEGSLVNAQSGALNVTATGNVRLADLRSAGGTIRVTSSSQGILDNTASEAALISGGAGTEVELRADTNIGTGVSGGANDIDLAVSRIAAVAATGNIVLINTGALELGTVNGLVGLDAGDRVLVTTASPLTVASNVTGAGNVTLTSTDAAGPGDNLTINAGVTVESTGADVVLNSGDDFLLALTGEVIAATTITINVDPITDGAGATVDLLGNVDATQTTINGGSDADTFNILPTDDSPITVNGGLPTFPGPGDVLNMDFNAITNPLLTLGAAPGSGTFDFPSDSEQSVDYTGIENVNTSTGAYHLVLNMLTSGFQDGSADTIDASVDNATNTDLLLDINGNNFFTGAVADILSFTVLGSEDADTLNINENANGFLPFFQLAAPASIAGSNGSHLNASAKTFLDGKYVAPAAPFTVDDVTMHFDGGLGSDRVNVNFSTDHDAGYFADVNAGQQGSGNIFAATTAGADIDLGLSFVHLEGVGINGTTTGGGLRVDASSTPLTNNISISDVGPNNDGVSLIDGNMQFTDMLFRGFNELQVVSGTGGELLDLIGLDTTTSLTDVELNANDVNGTDTASDTIRVRSTPAGTVANVTLLGGAGNDFFQIYDAGNTVDNINAAIQVFGEGFGDTDVDTLTFIDSGDLVGGHTYEVTSTTIEDTTSSPVVDVTFTDIDELIVTASGGNDTINVNLGAQEDLNEVTINGAGGDDIFNLQNSTPAGVDTRLNGNAGLDHFIFSPGSVLTGVIDGGLDYDTIDYSGYAVPVHVVLNALGTDDGFRGTEATSILETLLATGFDNIDNLVGTLSDDDILEGPDLRNYWGITSTNEGLIIADRVNLNSGRPTIVSGPFQDGVATPPEQRLDFTDFQNLIGGSQDDRFDLSDGAGLTGTLDGGLGNDSLDYRDYTTGVTVNLFQGTATNIGGLVVGTGGVDDDNSIENVFGGNGNDNITGDNDNNILGDGFGSDNLDGGGFGAGGGSGAGGSGNGGNDVFLIEPGNAGSADVITDIHGNDTIDFRFAGAGVTFDVDIINAAQTVFGTSTVELRQIQPEQPSTNPSFMENVVGSQYDDYIYIDPLSQDGNYPIDGPPVLRSADGLGGTDFLDFDSKGQEVIDTGFSLTADGVGTVQYLNFENVTPFEDNPAFIVDNGDPGFTFTGDWPYYTLSNLYLTTGAGYEDDFYSVNQLSQYTTGPAQAFWEFYGLTPGAYRVSVTWPVFTNPSGVQHAATDAPYTVYDGSRNDIGTTAADLGTFDVNQQLEPDDYSADGATWEILGTFNVSSRTLTVMLTNLADGVITADAIRIERVSVGPEVELVDITDALAPPAQIVDGDPDGIQFGPTELKTDVVRTFEIRNTSLTDSLTLSNLVVPTGYIVSGFPASVAANSSATFTITMGSDTFGDRSGILSFDTDDVDEATFNILLDGQVSNVVIIDDGDVGEFIATGSFVSFSDPVNGGSLGYEGDITAGIPNAPGSTTPPGAGSATWTFTGLAAGNYRVSTTWSQFYNRVTDAPYSLDGGGGPFDVVVDQSVAPSSFIEDGTAWFDLSTSFAVDGSGQLVVTLTNEASNFIRDHFSLSNGVIADAIRIEYLPEPDIEITVDGGTVVDDDTGVVDFGSTLPGIPVIKTFTITNLSTTETVSVTGLVEFPPGFSILPGSDFGTDTSTHVLAPNGSVGDSITFSIQFDGGTNGTAFGKVSFTTGDADENPYNFTVRGEAGPATVGVNDATNFSTTGTWEGYTPGNVGDPLFLHTGELFQTGTGANAATWTFDVEPGRYQVVAHWDVNPDITVNGKGAATNAPYVISDGVSPVTVLINQSISSNDFLDDGLFWEYIGDPYVVSDPNTTLTVQLSDLANGIIYADEVRIYRVVDPVVKVEVDGGTVEDGGTVNFDDTIVGAPVIKTFTVTNYGERNMALSPTINVPSGFSVVSGFGSTNLPPGASTTFTLQMNAGSEASFSGMVSFGVDSADANPFNFTVSGSAAGSMIIDNGDLGYTTSGDWLTRSATTIYDYYENDQDELYGGDQPGTNTASWEFTNLAAGSYTVSAHWAAHSGLASNAQYVISGIEGGDITVTLDQRFAANDTTAAGVDWETFGTFQVAA
uniref:golvesin C-terminal-like domain-containing protein n=1 Tax=Gimesia sp. TaxID=2024833 RepID=UPI003A8EE80F